MSRIESAHATIFCSRRAPNQLWSWRCDCGASAPSGTRQRAKAAVEHHLLHDCILVEATRQRLSAPQCLSASVPECLNAPVPPEIGGDAT